MLIPTKKFKWIGEINEKPFFLPNFSIIVHAWFQHDRLTENTETQAEQSKIHAKQ